MKSKTEINREYYERNRERIIAQNAVWAASNLDKRRQYDQARRRRNPEHVRALARNRELARRARKKDAFVEHVDSRVVYDRDHGVCQICKEAIGNADWHIDHVIPLTAGGAHSYANTQLSHAACNVRKGSKVLG